jgi:hypothetical protein
VLNLYVIAAEAEMGGCRVILRDVGVEYVRNLFAEHSDSGRSLDVTKSGFSDVTYRLKSLEGISGMEVFQDAKGSGSSTASSSFEKASCISSSVASRPSELLNFSFLDSAIDG